MWQINLAALLKRSGTHSIRAGAFKRRSYFRTPQTIASCSSKNWHGLSILRLISAFDSAEKRDFGTCQMRPRKEVEAEALALLERVGLAGKENSLPHELSGGQQQRVAIVRSLLLHPEVLLLDEVTASLDPEMVREVLELVGELAREGYTMIIVTHELQFAKAVADRVLFLEKGAIVEEGDAKAFFNHPKTQRTQEFLSVFDFSTVTD